MLSVWSQAWRVWDSKQSGSSEGRQQLFFRELINIQRKTMLWWIVIPLSYSQQTDIRLKSWPALSSTIAKNFWNDKSKSCLNPLLTFLCATSGLLPLQVSPLPLLTETVIQSLIPLSASVYLMYLSSIYLSNLSICPSYALNKFSLNYSLTNNP